MRAPWRSWGRWVGHLAGRRARRCRVIGYLACDGPLGYEGLHSDVDSLILLLQPQSPVSALMSCFVATHASSQHSCTQDHVKHVCCEEQERFVCLGLQSSTSRTPSHRDARHVRQCRHPVHAYRCDLKFEVMSVVEMEVESPLFRVRNSYKCAADFPQPDLSAPARRFHLPTRHLNIRSGNAKYLHRDTLRIDVTRTSPAKPRRETTS